MFDVLKGKFSFPVYTVGPTIPPSFKLNLGVGVGDESSSSSSSVPTTTTTTTSGSEWLPYVRWLNSQPRGSLSCFPIGTLSYLPHEKIEEIVIALRISDVRFLWMAGSTDHKANSQLLEACGDRGMVVPWSDDQLKVLCMPSFYWRFLDSMRLEFNVFASVPMLTFPTSWDQISNSKKIVEDWKVGWRVKSPEAAWENVVFFL